MANYNNKLKEYQLDVTMPAYTPGVDSNTKLMLHMNGTEGSTTFEDSSWSKNEVTANNVIITTAQSKFGGACGYFSGDSSYLDVEYFEGIELGSGNSYFTIDFWIRIESYIPWAGIISTFKESNSSGYAICFDSSGKRIIFYTANSETEGYTDLELNTWYHVAISGYSFLEGYIFIDGIEDGYYELSEETADSQNPWIITIGRYDKTQTNYRNFNGWIDELRIIPFIKVWDYEFTPPEYEYNQIAVKSPIPEYGNTGNLLAKKSNDNNDVDWVEQTFEVSSLTFPIYYIFDKNTDLASRQLMKMCVDVIQTSYNYMYRYYLASNGDMYMDSIFHTEYPPTFVRNYTITNNNFAVYNNHIYIINGTCVYHFVSRSEETGNLLFDHGANIRNICVDNNNVYVTTYDDTCTIKILKCYDKTSGTLVWTVDESADLGSFYACASDNMHVYVTASKRNIDSGTYECQVKKYLCTDGSFVQERFMITSIASPFPCWFYLGGNTGIKDGAISVDPYYSEWQPGELYFSHSKDIGSVTPDYQEYYNRIECKFFRCKKDLSTNDNYYIMRPKSLSIYDTIVSISIYSTTYLCITTYTNQLISGGLYPITYITNNNNNYLFKPEENGNTGCYTSSRGRRPHIRIQSSEASYTNFAFDSVIGYLYFGKFSIDEPLQKHESLGTNSLSIGKAFALGDNSFAIGENNQVFGNKSSVEGYNNTVGGNFSHISGQDNFSDFGQDSDFSWAHGKEHIIRHQYSNLEGYRVQTNMVGQHSQGSVPYVENHAVGDGGFANYTRVIREVTSSGSDPDRLPRVVSTSPDLSIYIADYTVVYFSFDVLATRSKNVGLAATRLCKSWEVKGICRRTESSTLILLGSTSTVIFGDTGTESWNVVAAIDDTTKTLYLSITSGEAGINWATTLHMTQMSNQYDF